MFFSVNRALEAELQGSSQANVILKQRTTTVDRLALHKEKLRESPPITELHSLLQRHHLSRSWL